jgi:hypothetical protein
VTREIHAVTYETLAAVHQSSPPVVDSTPAYQMFVPIEAGSTMNTSSGLSSTSCATTMSPRKPRTAAQHESAIQVGRGGTASVPSRGRAANDDVSTADTLSP